MIVPRLSFWHFLLGISLLGLLGASPVAAQQWSGAASLGLAGGYQTNPYLDPVAETWDPTFDSAFTSLTPQLSLTREGQRTRFDLSTRSLLYPGQDNRPQLLQGFAQGRYRLSPSWSLGLVGGATRYRLTVSRDGWWALPSVRWTPTSNATLTLRAGLTQRVDRSSSPAARQWSGLATLRAAYWLNDRLRGALQLYRSDGRTAASTESGYGGTGASLSATYWPSSAFSLTAQAGAEQVQYQFSSSDVTPQDRVGRLGLSAEWDVHPSVSVFGRARALQASLAGADNTDADVHGSIGVRLQVQRTLGEDTSASSTPRRAVCRPTDEGLRFRVPYDGTGTPHVTGAFSSWSLPGIPLAEVDDGVWGTTVDVSPGRYPYRIRVVEADSARWLSLPSYARTAEDDFGGTNGVCIAP
ncbi:MAG: glycogen-binding domain-containing protein [Salinibacter sp.]